MKVKVSIFNFPRSISRFSFTVCNSILLGMFFEIKSSLYSRYYSKECNEWRSPSLRLSAWATQLQRKVAAVTSRWRFCVQLDAAGNPTTPFRTNGYVFNHHAGNVVAMKFNGTSYKMSLCFFDFLAVSCYLFFLLIYVMNSFCFFINVQFFFPVPPLVCSQYLVKSSKKSR